MGFLFGVHRRRPAPVVHHRNAPGQDHMGLHSNLWPTLDVAVRVRAPRCRKSIDRLEPLDGDHHRPAIVLTAAVKSAFTDNDFACEASSSLYGVQNSLCSPVKAHGRTQPLRSGDSTLDPWASVLGFTE